MTWLHAIPALLWVLAITADAVMDTLAHHRHSTWLPDTDWWRGRGTKRGFWIFVGDGWHTAKGVRNVALIGAVVAATWLELGLLGGALYAVGLIVLWGATFGFTYGWLLLAPAYRRRQPYSQRFPARYLNRLY